MAPAGDGGAAPEPQGFARQFGRRNLGYLGFVALLVPLGIALEASGPRGPDAGGGVAAALLLWAVVSAGFFLVNAVLLAVALHQGRPAAKPAIACALPVVVVLFTMSLASLVEELGFSP